MFPQFVQHQRFKISGYLSLWRLLHHFVAICSHAFYLHFPNQIANSFRFLIHHQGILDVAKNKNYYISRRCKIVIGNLLNCQNLPKLWSCLEIELYSLCQKTDYDWYAQQPLWFCYLIQQWSTLSCFFSCITIFLYDLYIVCVLSEPNFNSLIKVSVSRHSKLWKVKLCSPEHRLHSYPTRNNYCNLKSLEMEHIFSYNCSNHIHP